MHTVLGTKSVPPFWFLDIMYIQVKSVLRVRSHSCTNKRQDGPLLPTHKTYKVQPEGLNGKRCIFQPDAMSAWSQGTTVFEIPIPYLTSFLCAVFCSLFEVCCPVFEIVLHATLIFCLQLKHVNGCCNCMSGLFFFC